MVAERFEPVTTLFIALCLPTAPLGFLYKGGLYTVWLWKIEKDKIDFIFNGVGKRRWQRELFFEIQKNTLECVLALCSECLSSVRFLSK